VISGGLGTLAATALIAARVPALRRYRAAGHAADEAAAVLPPDRAVPEPAE